MPAWATARRWATTRRKSPAQLHDIQYLGAATRYELRLDNGQSFAVSQANSQWNPPDAPARPGQRVSARWARAAMVPLREAPR